MTIVSKYLAVASFIGGVLLGALVNGWRKDVAISALKLTHADFVEELQQATADAVAETEEKAAAERAKFVQVDRNFYQELLNAKRNEAKLRDGIDSGKYRVYIRASCPTATTVSGTPDASSVDSGTAVELSPDARRTYYRLREEIIEDKKKLLACQALLKEEQ